MKTPEFIMLSGIPASGKSTTAKEILKNNPDLVYINLDEIFKEKNGTYGMNNEDYLNQSFALMRKAIKEKKSVLYDATNGLYKRRKGVLEYFKLKDYHTTIIYHVSTLENAIKNNMKRKTSTVVGNDVIKTHYFDSQVPVSSEADTIIYKTHEQVDLESKQWLNETKGLLIENPYKWLEDNSKEIELFLPEVHRLKGYDQYNSHHTLDVYGHTAKVTHNMSQLSNDLVMILSALFHDLGKYEARVFTIKQNGLQYLVLNGLDVLLGNENIVELTPLYKTTNKVVTLHKNELQTPIRGAFYKHENISSKLAYNLSIRLGLTEEESRNISYLCQLHMAMPNERTLENQKQWERLLVKIENLYEPLKVLRIADKNGK